MFPNKAVERSDSYGRPQGASRHRSPSPCGVLFGRTTSRRLRFEASRNEPAPVAATVPLGPWCSKQSGGTKRFVWPTSRRQSPSLAITIRVLFGRTTSRRLRFEASRTSPLRWDFEVGRDGDPSPDSRRYRSAALRAFSRTYPSSPGSGDCPVRSPGVPNKAVERSDSYGRPQGAVAIARHHHAGAVRADDIKATAF